MNIVELFPKRKRVIGWDEHGRRTAHSLNQDQAFHDRHGLGKKGPSWAEMQADILACENHFQLMKCTFYWANIAERDKWPRIWMELARDEFDKAVEAIEALPAQQGE